MSAQDQCRIVAAYDYRDEQGRLMYQNVKFTPKTFRVRRPTPEGGWTWNRDGIMPVPYRLPELISASTQDFLLVTEGERDVETLRALGFSATTSGGADSWRTEFARYFQGRLVCVLPDADEAGQRYARAVVESLAPVAGEVRLAQVPFGYKDISDYVEGRDAVDEGVLRADVLGMIDAAPVIRADPRGPLPTGGTQAEDASRPVYAWMKDIDPKPVQWLWQDRVPCAMLSLLIGLEGSGKTFLALDLAARVTTGRPLPGGDDPYNTPPVGNVVFLTSEDHLSFTIRPRLDAMGADPARIAALQGVKGPEGETEFFDVMQHLPALEMLIEEAAPVQLVVVDPLTAFLGETDQHRNGEVRRALARFNALAEKYGCAILGISHLSKDVSRQAIHRTIGSVAFSAAARAVWLVSADKEDDRRRILCPVKSNLCPLAKSLAFRIDQKAVTWEAGEFDYKADEVLAVDHSEDQGAVAEAARWLAEALEGGRMRSAELQAMAKREGISSGTLKRAKAKLGVQAVHEGVGSASFWYWRLPKEIQDDHQVAQ
ncbi:MAG: AAA family ATPase [Phycisphaerae bacterium]|nr:AAA family ATPase [Phycisphaerae bacterium]